MGLGLGIVLIVVGAIISFTSLDETILDVNLDTVGWILLIAGILALIIGLVMNGQRAKGSRTVIEHRDEDIPPERRH